MEERANENREMTIVLSYVKLQSKRITKENGSIYKSTRKRGNLRK